MISMKKISVTAGGKAILQDLSLHISEGEKLLITGASGSGKSTLLRAMLFFTPFSGELQLRSNPVTEETLEEYRSRIAFLGQSVPPFSGRAEEVLFLPWSYRANRHLQPDRKRALSLLKRLGLQEEQLDAPFATLSGGEKQRLMLAQILLMDKELIVLDEPTVGLDPSNRRKVVKLLCGLKGRTVVVVSHDPEWPEAVGRCLVVAGGRVRKGRCVEQ